MVGAGLRRVPEPSLRRRPRPAAGRFMIVVPAVEEGWLSRPQITIATARGESTNIDSPQDSTRSRADPRTMMGLIGGMSTPSGIPSGESRCPALDLIRRPQARVGRVVARSRLPQQDAVPADSERRRSATVHRSRETRRAHDRRLRTDPAQSRRRIALLDDLAGCPFCQELTVRPAAPA
jgi:hypothetical protein